MMSTCTKLAGWLAGWHDLHKRGMFQGINDRGFLPATIAAAVATLAPASWLCCICGLASNAPHGYAAYADQSSDPPACRENQLMQHLAATMRMMIGDIDLTVSDAHVNWPAIYNAAVCRENQLMQHLAATMRMMIGDIDLTVSDRHCALVLCQALQQLQRRRRVARCLLPKDKWREQASTDVNKSSTMAQGPDSAKHCGAPGGAEWLAAQ